MIELLKRLSGMLHLRRSPRWRYFELEESLQAALLQRADQEQRPQEELQAEILAAGLARLQKADWLRLCWDQLSPREQEVAALTCIGCTNRQMAGRMNLSEETIKTYISRILDKFDMHSKAELRETLSDWNFSKWELPLS
jgi:DNA-binding NarL/FixJ family response regulator